MLCRSQAPASRSLACSGRSCLLGPIAPRCPGLFGSFKTHPRTSHSRSLAARPDDKEQAEKRRRMEDELRDPKNFLEYLLPRPVRIVFLAGTAASCLIAAVLAIVRLVQDPPGAESHIIQDLIINLAGLAVFTALALWERSAGEQRVEQRREIREAQIAFGDREVFVNEEGEKMSRLKEVNDDWILRRLERWGQQEGMPFVGPRKGGLLQQMVRDKQPRLAVEVGTMAGYSAILIAQVLPRGSRLISFESQLSWFLVAKRFLWQASQGKKDSKIQDKVDVRWGDALQQLPKLSPTDKIDLLFLDGIPKEYLAYLKAAEPYLAPDALIIADNAGVFSQGGLKPYLDYVRSDSKYRSAFVESTLEWRDDVADGLEVSTYLGTPGQGQGHRGSEVAQAGAPQ